MAHVLLPEDEMMHDAPRCVALFENAAVSGLHAQRELLAGGVAAKGLGKCAVFIMEYGAAVCDGEDNSV